MPVAKRSSNFYRLDDLSEGTYGNLPVLPCGPAFCNTLNDNWLRSALELLYEVLSGNFVDMNSFNCVFESVSSQDFVLLSPVVVFGPLGEEHVRPVFRLVVVHQLFDAGAQHSTVQFWWQSPLLGEFYCLLVHFLLNFQQGEECRSLAFFSAQLFPLFLQVCLHCLQG
jgi:hypothetical protein